VSSRRRDMNGSGGGNARCGRSVLSHRHQLPDRHLFFFLILILLFSQCRRGRGGLGSGGDIMCGLLVW
jgi:hypothetical protein